MIHSPAVVITASGPTGCCSACPSRRRRSSLSEMAMLPAGAIRFPRISTSPFAAVRTIEPPGCTASVGPGYHDPATGDLVFGHRDVGEPPARAGQPARRCWQDIVGITAPSAFSARIVQRRVGAEIRREVAELWGVVLDNHGAGLAARAVIVDGSKGGLGCRAEDERTALRQEVAARRCARRVPVPLELLETRECLRRHHAIQHHRVAHRTR